LPPGGAFLRVDDPLAALGRFAAAYRSTMPARVVGVSGSVGKTTTKELIADALSTQGKTARTRGNFNNEIGLPLSVAEMGPRLRVRRHRDGHQPSRRYGHAARHPDAGLAVMTRIGPVHIEFFGSVRAIAEEKAALLEKLPADGFAVLDLDDECFDVLRAHASAPVETCSLKRREADYAGDVQAGGRLWVFERATGESATLPVPPPGGFMAATR
jgi:UDP-N-acetylmuramyl pentapeptide synthase